MDAFHVKMTAGFIETAHQSAVSQLKGSLATLICNAERALKDLENGEGLDEHLIHNSVHLTAQIGRYNLTRDLRVMLPVDAE